MILVKSVRSRAMKEDGPRILIDLFWPEGIKTNEVVIDEWAQELSPSYDLQRFAFSPENWDSYSGRYREELLQSEQKRARLQELAKRSKGKPLTLLYGNHDARYNNATVVKDIIENEFH